jgi:glyoxylase-like metal-dependent hydrolase (beta-lactamase superfamily II)
VKLNFEIEFHPVGDDSKTGHANTVRYGTEGGYRVIIINGVTDDSGKRIVQHVKSVYGPRTILSDVISTHPDSDHACGRREILRELLIQPRLVHGLWYHAADTKKAIVSAPKDNAKHPRKMVLTAARCSGESHPRLLPRNGAACRNGASRELRLLRQSRSV